MANLYKKTLRKYAKKSAYKRIKAKEAKRGAKERYRLFGMGNNGSNTIIRNPEDNRRDSPKINKGEPRPRPQGALPSRSAHVVIT